ncbi:hypothetical protein [Geomonas sp.]|uniref:hypothetical protein n=1 Tax=Geomonas sp. TaxID=2651584 RepID=UPI002B465892|nr:hypothetical protein [Geomonas sp.]HJV34209.1 hypothetical protein [Geomonas sp.]
MAAALLFWWSGGPAAMAAGTIDYLYVEANEGDSSGGHVALRFGEETYHFQQESPGILRIRRHDAAAFHHIYAMLGNRTIHESRIAVSDDTYSLLREAFARLLAIQDAQADRREALRHDSELFELLLRRATSLTRPSATLSPEGARVVGPQERGDGEIQLPVSGLGYFGKEGAPSDGDLPFSPAVAALRGRIVATYGDSFLVERAERARMAIQQLELRAAGKQAAISRDSYPIFSPTVATRYDDALHALMAVKMLQRGAPLRSGAYWTPEGDLFKLRPREVEALKRSARQLEDDLVRLAASQRGDWGVPFLLGIARLEAIEASLDRGRLVLLDIFDPAVKLPANQDAALRPYLPMMESDLRKVFLQKKERFFAEKGFSEAAYALMERSGNLLLDVERAKRTGTSLRAVPQKAFPSRAATVSVPLPGHPDQAALLREEEAARAAEREYAAELNGLYGYDLFHRNCVTELFAVINRTFSTAGGAEGAGSVATAGRQGTPREESEKRLGGFVDASQGLDFIPFISAAVVENNYKVVESRDLPSYRAARLAEMKAHEATLKVFLRESNTITSTVYRPGPGDSTFLFFTDDNLPLRPLFGVVNLLVGLGQGLIGVVTMPVEGPDRFLSGTKGVLFSLPELVFINLRKGSTAYVEGSADRGDGAAVKGR